MNINKATSSSPSRTAPQLKLSAPIKDYDPRDTLVAAWPKGRNVADRTERLFDSLKRKDNTSEDLNPKSGVVETRGSQHSHRAQARLEFYPSQDQPSYMTFTDGLGSGMIVTENDYGTLTTIESSKIYGHNNARIGAFDENWSIIGGALEPTDEDIDGPYYRDGAPERGDVHPGQEGQRLNLDFGIRDSQGMVIPNAKVEVWMADAEGEYDNDSADFQGRGWQNADDQGTVKFQSLRPGNYEIPGEIRPAHIHVRISAEGRDPLTTQLYFSDDPHNSSDRWYDPARCLTAPSGPQEIAASKGPVRLGQDPVAVTLKPTPQVLGYDFILK